MRETHSSNIADAKAASSSTDKCFWNACEANLFLQVRMAEGRKQSTAFLAPSLSRKVKPIRHIAKRTEVSVSAARKVGRWINGIKGWNWRK